MLEHGVHHMFILDIDEKQGHEAVAHLNSLFETEARKPVILFNLVDVTDETAVNSIIDIIAEAVGSIDLLVCFAGITGSELSIEYDIERWRKIFDVNVHGSFLVARSVARLENMTSPAGCLIIKY